MALPNELYNAKFAEYLESIKILYLVDDKFQMLCDDYCNNKISSEKLSKKLEKSLTQKIKLENLSIELEDEILFYVIRKM